MYTLIKQYIDNLTIDKLNTLALKKNITLSQEELNFSYNFIKTNWQIILSNHGNFNYQQYKEKFNSDNYNKIIKLLKEYKIKYSKYI